jgi:hypothetical protein
VSDFAYGDGEIPRFCTGDCRLRKNSGCLGETLDINIFRDPLLCLKKNVDRCLVWVGVGLSPCGCGNKPGLLGAKPKPNSAA